MKELVILGNVYDNLEENYFKKECDIWILGVSCTDPLYKRYDSIFEIHSQDVVHNELADVYEKLKTVKVPVYMTYYDNAIPTCQLYPYRNIFKKYGKYIANSFVIMLLLAVENGYNKITIDGIDLTTDRERTQEIKCMEYWIGYFRGQGIDVRVPKDSYLCKVNYVYGKEDETIQKQLVMIDKRIGLYDSLYARTYFRYLDYHKDIKYNKNEKKELEFYSKMCSIKSRIKELEIIKSYI